MLRLRSFVWLLLFVPAIATQSQTYLDAIILDTYASADGFDLADEQKARIIAQAVQRYDTALTGFSTAGQVLNRIALPGSPDYNPILADLIQMSGAAGASSIGLGTQAEGLGSGGIGGLNVTKLADGLARFLVRRTKDELNVAFFRRFQKAMNKQPEMRILFPQTTNVLNAIGRDIYRFSYFIESLRESFQKDLNLLPTHLEPLLVNSSLIKSDTLQVLATEGLRVSQSVINGLPALGIIHQLANDPWQSNTANLGNLKSSFQVLDILAAGLGGDQGWASQVKLDQMIRQGNGQGLKIFCGLLYPQMKRITFRSKDGSSFNCGDFLVQLDNANTTTQIIAGFAQRLANQGKLMDAVADSIRAQKVRGGTNPDNYYQFTNALLASFQEGILFKQYVTGTTNATDSLLLDITDLLNEINLDVLTKNYNSAIINTSLVLERVVRDKAFGWKGDLLRYGSFIALVAKAETSEEVAQAIEAVALPVGSSSIKKYSRFNLSVQSYVGGFVGDEYLLDVNEDEGQRIYGITAPLGFSASFGINPKKDWGAIGVFIPLADIGAFTALRFDDDQTAELPAVKLENIIAPGAYLILSAPKLPITLGFGGQLGPQLREVTSTTTTLTEARGYRLSAFAAVDIPLFNLFTSAK
ncbi:MAG: hypothetical protein AAF206_24955 [Bacteroidota bacterium]